MADLGVIGRCEQVIGWSSERVFSGSVSSVDDLPLAASIMAFDSSTKALVGQVCTRLDGTFTQVSPRTRGTSTAFIVCKPLTANENALIFDNITPV